MTMTLTKILTTAMTQEEALKAYATLERISNGNSHVELFYLFGGAFAAIWVLCLLNLIATAIGRYKIFKKAGESGYKAFIPGYSTYTLYRIAWDEKCFTSLLCLIGLSILTRLIGGPVFNAIGIAISFAIMLMQGILCSKLAISFDKKVEFALGLFFLHPIFTLILGFSDARYLGPEGTRIEDIFEDLV